MTATAKIYHSYVVFRLWKDPAPTWRGYLVAGVNMTRPPTREFVADARCVTG